MVHDHDTLEFDAWSMVTKFNQGHTNPGICICPMVNSQNGYFVVKPLGSIKGLRFRPQEIRMSAMVMTHDAGCWPNGQKIVFALPNTPHPPPKFEPIV